MSEVAAEQQAATRPQDVLQYIKRENSAWYKYFILFFDSH